MDTDKLIVGHGKMGKTISLEIEIIERQADIVPRIVEKYKRTAVDFIQIGAFSGMNSGEFHTRDVNVVPSAGVSNLVDYSRTFLRPTNFVQPLVYFGKLASIYYFNPRVESAQAYKEQFGWSPSRRTLKVGYEPCMQGHWLVWQHCFSSHITNFKPKEMKREDVAVKINKSLLPLVFNISLDALQYLQSNKTQKALEREAEIHAGVLTNGFRESAAYWQGKDIFRYYSSASLLNEPSLNDFTFELEECSVRRLKNEDKD